MSVADNSSEDSHVGVHQAHCCNRCGCKYGDLDCPVFTKQVDPLYRCWECEEDRKALVERLKALSPSEQVDIFREVFF